MTGKGLCVEPKIGRRIGEYNRDAATLSEDRKLSVEERTMLETHLLRCSFCRKKLNLAARMWFETRLVLSGCFLEGKAYEKRRKAYEKYLRGTSEKTDWLEVSDEERKKIKAFMEGDP